ncbi:hypothetical protein CIG2463D_1484 [Campylobacter iguaniorum]|uniref:hypothetical protein n=1 Tax=Campylobacter iguaniorum TaxID=1244531 RepID=UPI00073A66FB|nr:hypothetical protein [Campylobacter iguaniorum]ALV25049.1 hypothetical protein CIG2463D_1484 [Campylobacter iguaniorum]
MSRKIKDYDKRLINFGNIRFTIKDILELKQVAISENTTVSALIRAIIKDYLSKKVE